MSFEQILGKASDALVNNSMGGMSLGEKLAVALVLNRADWLAKLDYTIPEALDRLDASWVALIPQVAKVLAESNRVVNDAARTAAEANTIEMLRSSEDGSAVDIRAELVTYGHAPGYRDVSLVADLTGIHLSTPIRARLSFSAKDSASIAAHIIEVHQWAWRGTETRNTPLDLQEGEGRPRWLP